MSLVSITIYRARAQKKLTIKDKGSILEIAEEYVVVIVETKYYQKGIKLLNHKDNIQAANLENAKC